MLRRIEFKRQKSSSLARARCGLRRTGLKRLQYVPPPAAPLTRARGGVITRIDDVALAMPKENALTSLVYQALGAIIAL